MVCPFGDPQQRASGFLNCKRKQLELWWDVKAINHAENCLPNWEYYHCLPSIFSPYLHFLINTKTNSQSTHRFITMPLDSSQTSISLQRIGLNIKKELGIWVWKSLIGYLSMLRKSLIIRKKFRRSLKNFHRGKSFYSLQEYFEL